MHAGKRGTHTTTRPMHALEREISEISDWGMGLFEAPDQPPIPASLLSWLHPWLPLPPVRACPCPYRNGRKDIETSPAAAAAHRRASRGGRTSMRACLFRAKFFVKKKIFIFLSDRCVIQKQIRHSFKSSAFFACWWGCLSIDVRPPLEALRWAALRPALVSVPLRPLR